MHVMCNSNTKPKCLFAYFVFFVESSIILHFPSFMCYFHSASFPRECDTDYHIFPTASNMDY